ncbi:MAG: hypothetical protein QGI32_24765 [Candidatus Latescibacteria bacterium]|nr:hypothetical protein [Candidatus Latescibacterota bacterium]
MHTRNHFVLAMAFCLLVLPAASTAQVSHLVIGQGGLDWRGSAVGTVGIDTSVTASLQPFELDPAANIAVGPVTEGGAFTTVFGHRWERSFSAPPAVEDKQPWVYGSRGQILTIDGDDDQPTDIAEVGGYSFDLGMLLPINRVVFFPPEKGTTTGAGVGTFENAFSEGSQGQLYKDQYPRHYIVSASVNEGEFLRQSTANDFDTIVGSNTNHSQRVADVRFDTDFLRFIRLRFPVTGFIAEVKFYGEGFVPETRWVSQLFDMGEPVNFGRLNYDFEVYRSPGFGLEPELDPHADVRVEIELRSGRDDSPQIHHIVTEIGTEAVVSEKDFNRAPSTYLGSGSGIAIPGQQGSILDDVENWSFWSAPHTSPGEEIRSPDGRQFIQVRAFLTSSDVFAFGRLKSMAIEFSPLLANPVLGEVALMDEPQPEDGVVEVPLGEPVSLTYDVRADFTSDSQVGFDAIRLETPEAVEFQRFEMGEPLVAVTPDSLIVETGALVVYFPSNPVLPAANTPLRLTFNTRVFNFSTEFSGQVFQIGGENLSQSIEGGDATPTVSTNDLRVIAPLDKLEVLSELDLESPVITPNGDGIHDELQLSYTLHGIASGGVEAGVYDLAGRLVRRLASESRSEGRYIDSWSGQIEGRQVPPGTYLVRVAVETDLGTFKKIRTVAIAY